jgi:CRP/FNR family transcriptional regulator
MAVSQPQPEGGPREGLVRSALRAVLGRDAERLGLNATAIDVLVERAQLTHWDAREPIGTSEDAEPLTNFVIAGAVKVVCTGRRGTPIVVQFVRPGQLFGLTLPSDRPPPQQFAAIAHVASTVAMVSGEAMTQALAALPPVKSLRLMGYTWRALSHLLHEKCLMLTMPLRDRLVHALGVLARDFGQPHEEGVMIALPLTHADLAQLIAGTRANVSRAVSELRRAGQLAVVDGQFVLPRPRTPALTAGPRR